MTELREEALNCLRTAQTAALEAVKVGRATPQVRVLSHWSFPEYKYGPNGPELGSGSVIAEELPDWTKATEDVLGTVRATGEYARLISALKLVKKDPLQPEAAADSALREFIAQILANGEVASSFLGEVADLVERRTQGLSVLHHVNIRLVGLLVRDGPVAIESKGISVKIRPVSRADVEGDFGGPFTTSPFMGLVPHPQTSFDFVDRR